MRITLLSLLTVLCGLCAGAVLWVLLGMADPRIHVTFRTEAILISVAAGLAAASTVWRMGTGHW